MNLIKILAYVSGSGLFMFLINKYIKIYLKKEALLIVKTILNDLDVKLDVKKLAKETVNELTEDKNVRERGILLFKTMTDDDDFMVDIKNKVKAVLSDDEIVLGMKQSLDKLLSNNEFMNIIKSKLKEVVSDDDLVEALKININKLLDNDELMNIVRGKMVFVLTNILNDEELRKTIMNYMLTILNDPDINETIVRILQEYLKDDGLKNAASEFLKDVFGREDVKHKLNTLLFDSAISTAHNKDIQNEFKRMIDDILHDTNLRSSATDSVKKVLPIGVGLRIKMI